MHTNIFINVFKSSLLLLVQEIYLLNMVQRYLPWMMHVMCKVLN